MAQDDHCANPSCSDEELGALLSKVRSHTAVEDVMLYIEEHMAYMVEENEVHKETHALLTTQTAEGSNESRLLFG
jgi:hypothetical protein